MFRRFGYPLSAGFLIALFTLAPSWAAIKEDPLSETAQMLQKKFSGGGTLEYHFMLKAPPFTDDNKEQVMADLISGRAPAIDIHDLGLARYA